MEDSREEGEKQAAGSYERNCRKLKTKYNKEGNAF
jgi:hypothetical protein